MKQLIALAIVLMMFTLTGCEVIGDIFSAGFYSALILVVIVVAIIVFVAAKIRGKR
jgi:hypothetical protein